MVFGSAFFSGHTGARSAIQTDADGFGEPTGLSEASIE
ncbi:hypothetical protein X767_14650 [Mesorhizobium sp. LSJC264A00]|nr:hypothetical protein X767_14650 [Mesorhizobium sp. LSJC264A00]